MAAIMDTGIDLSHGMKGLILSLIGIYILPHLIRALWIYFNRNRGPTAKQFDDLTKALEATSLALNEQKLISKKMSTDIRRIYLFLKIIAGGKWPKYRSKVEEFERENNIT